MGSKLIKINKNVRGGAGESSLNGLLKISSDMKLYISWTAIAALFVHALLARVMDLLFKCA